MQLNFLFWNTGGLTPDQEVAQLAKEHDSHVVVLIEYNGDGLSVQSALTSHNSLFNMIPPLGCKRVKAFTTFPSSSIAHGPEEDRFTIKQLSIAGHLPLILGLAHLPSKLHANPGDQLQIAQYFKHSIEQGERTFNHQDTLILGDFNMNPFDQGMISTMGLNAVSCLQVAQRGSRRMNGIEHKFFYNPSWNLLGDFSQPAGTYYHSSPNNESHYWNTLDQVIIRPALAKHLVRNSLRVVTQAGSEQLIKSNGHPGISDHLPIAFSLELQRIP